MKYNNNYEILDSNFKQFPITYIIVSNSSIGKENKFYEENNKFRNIKTLDGEYDNICKDKTIIIQYFIESYKLNKNEVTYEQTIERADCYGKIVETLKTLPIKLPDANLSSWYSKDNFTLSVKKHENLLPMLDDNDPNDKKIKRDILDKIEMIKSISSNTNFNEIVNLSVLNTHGDYNVL